jgi:hypothetical protein
MLTPKKRSSSEDNIRSLGTHRFRVSHLVGAFDLCVNHFTPTFFTILVAFTLSRFLGV